MRQLSPLQQKYFGKGKRKAGSVVFDSKPRPKRKRVARRSRNLGGVAGAMKSKAPIIDDSDLKGVA